jgi:hypothetical protein
MEFAVLINLKTKKCLKQVKGKGKYMLEINMMHFFESEAYLFDLAENLTFDDLGTNQFIKN